MTRWVHGFALVAVWVLTRGLMIRILRDFEWIKGDVQYYYASVAWPEGTIGTILREYPVPVVWFLHALRPLSDSSEDYVAVFAFTMGLLDAAFTAFLWFAPRFAPTADPLGSRLGAWFWTLFTALLGPIVWFRFDIIPAVVVGVAMVLVLARPALSGALIAFGASLKLWPALLLLPNLGRDRAARRRLAGFAVTGGALAGLAFVTSGWTRLTSPLTWQGERGLQIESLWATWPMFLHGFGRESVSTIFFSPFNAFELEGTGVERWSSVSDAAMVVVGLFAVALGVLALLKRPDTGTRTLAVVAITCGMLAANKTLSPQYMLWLAGPVASLLVHLPADRVGRMRCGQVALTTLLIGALTHYIFPIAYMSLIVNPFSGPTVTAALVWRNVLLGIVTIQVVVWSMRAMWAAPDARTASGEPAPTQAVPAATHE